MHGNRRKYLFLITGMVMGGAERVMATMANEFADRGHSVTIITMREPASAYRLDDRVKIYGASGTVDKSGLWRNMQLITSGVKGFRFYWKQMKRLQPDVVLSFLTNTNLLVVITHKLLQRNIPVVISERCDPLARGQVIRKICECLYPLADCLVCQSNEVGNYFLRVNKKTKIQVIPNPINTKCISDKIPDIRRQVIVGVGRLSKQKNYPLMIESFNRIQEKFPEYCVEIYGQGPEEENLNRLIISLGLTNKVFLMGIRENVMQEIYDATLFVMSSNYEGFPNALMEAMASGLPVICTDFQTGTAREVIEDGVNGFIVPVNDIEAMTNAMTKILGDLNLQHKMSENNRRIIDVLDPNEIINKWETVLNRSISREVNYEQYHQQNYS